MQIALPSYETISADVKSMLNLVRTVSRGGRTLVIIIRGKRGSCRSLLFSWRSSIEDIEILLSLWTDPSNVLSFVSRLHGDIKTGGEPLLRRRRDDSPFFRAKR